MSEPIVRTTRWVTLGAAFSTAVIGCGGDDVERATTPTCGDARGMAVELDLDLNMAGFNERHAVVHLPPCYDDDSDRYPVIYLLHGAGQRPESWTEDPIRATDIADRLAIDGVIAPAIVVFPPRSTMRVGFTEAVLDPLISEVDDRYRTIADPSGRAIGGFSVGGTITAVSAFTGAERFAAVGLFAASWSDSLSDEIADGMVGRSDQPSVYVNVGDRDPFVRHVPDIEAVLDQLSIEPTIDIVPGNHTVDFVAERFESWLGWFDGELSTT